MPSKSIRIHDEIVKRLGFFPPFFEPAVSTPPVLEELWRQTLTCYLDNPIPMLFKEKLAALLGRYCSVPYCLICHSASLRPMGMKAAEVLALLEEMPLSYDELNEKAAALLAEPIAEWPESGSSLEQGLLHCSVAIFLNQDVAQCHTKMRHLLGEEYYSYVMLFIAYNRVCLTWAEAHPELSHEADQRVIQNLGPLLADEPLLTAFFACYQQRALKQGARRTFWLTQENKRLVDEELRLRQEAELERNEKGALLDAISEGIYGVDLTGACTFANIAAARLLGYDVKAMAGQAIQVLTDPSGTRAEPPHYENYPCFVAMRTGHPCHENEVMLRRQDGSVFFAELTAVPIFADEQVRGAVVSLRDVTQERALREIEQQSKSAAEVERARLLHIFQQAPVAICMLEGPAHVYVVSNPFYLTLLGGRPLIGKPIREALPELVGQGIYELLDEVYHTGTAHKAAEREIELKNADGVLQTRYLDFIYQPLLSVKGEVEGIIVAASDVTALVLARQTLEQNEKHFRLLTESMPQLVWTADAHGSVTYVNARFLEYTGASLEMLGGPAWGQLVHPKDQQSVKNAWASAIEQDDDVYRAEYRLLRHDHVYRWMLSQAMAMRDGSGRITQWLGTCTDIDEQKENVEALQRERDVREKFVATLTHDLRSPLTAAKLQTQRALTRCGENAVLASSLKAVVKQVDRADHMIQDLLDVGRLRFGETLPVNMTRTDLRAMVKASLEDLVGAYGNRFAFDAPADPVWGTWDGNAMRRVFENLVTNAVKYGSTVHPISVALALQPGGARLSVQNEGSSLSKDEQKNIFEPFHRTHSAQSGGQKGWGLGLPLVKGVVEAHGGVVDVRSGPGIGTTFTVTVPFSRVAF